jgi:L-amino acid N-acyltransferase YncA
VCPLWSGVAEGWVISSKRIFQNKIKAARLIKKRTDLLCKNNKIWRLQTAVKANFTIGVRFAEFLGLKKEGLMEKYGPDKTDYFRMAKIYK